MSLDAFYQGIRNSHAREVDAGKHDDVCEWRDAGHFLCHCSKRRREAAGLTTPPTLWLQYPMCSQCMEETYHDGDSFVCDRCHVSWPRAFEDEPGTFTDDYGVLDTSKWDAPAVLDANPQPSEARL